MDNSTIATTDDRIAAGDPDPALRMSAIPAVARLVPQSGVQILDLELPTAGLAQELRSFTEHRYTADGAVRSVLMPIGRVGSGDIVWHPVSHRALAPGEILSVTGVAALQSYLGRWLPLPYFRYLGRDADGAATFDAGPENWARIFVAATPDELRNAGSLRLAIAFDTRLGPSDRSGERRYLAPTADDAILGASFKLASSSRDLSLFAGRPWIDAWLRHAFDGQRDGGVARPFALEHLARYLVLVDVLARLAPMPEIRLVDTLSRRWAVPVTATDLVLDIGAEDTAAVVVDHDGASVAAGPTFSDATPLELRDLTNPVVRHAGPLPTRVEFAPQPFGEAGLSRLSGRPDAFAWPSLVRIGHEAAALSLRASATPGVTGQSALTALLEDRAPADEAWRYGRDGGDGGAVGPVVAGVLLAHLAEDGTRLSDSGAAKAPAVRPRFAPSSLLMLFLAELLLQAVSAVNAVGQPQAAGRSAGTRRLQRVVVTVPGAMTPLEQQRILGSLDAAVDLVWQAQGWDAAQELGAPPRPETRLVPGTDVAAQMFAVRREIALRYGNEARPFVAAMSRAAAPAPGLRVVSVELGGASSGAVIADYALAADGSLAPVQAVADRWTGGVEAVVEAVASAFVTPAIAAALERGGMRAPELFLSRALDGTTARPSIERNLARRLASKIMRPAAAALVRIARELPAGLASGRRSYTLALLVARGGGRMQPQAREFDELAKRAGAADVRLEAVVVPLNQRHLDAVIRAASGPSVARAAELAARHDCDLVLVDGALGSVPAVRDALISRLPVEPSRIVLGGIAGDRSAADEEMSAGSLVAGRVAGVVGAYLAGTGAPGLAALCAVVGSMSRDATRPMPPMVSAVSPSPAAAVAKAPKPPLIEAAVARAQRAEQAGRGEP